MSVFRRFYARKPPRRLESAAAQRFFQALAKILEERRSNTLLDIGCHSGEKTVFLGECLRASHLVGVDINLVALAVAGGRGVRVAAADLSREESLPIAPDSVACVSLLEVIEHVFSPDHLLAEVQRVLVEDGLAVISTPNLASWRNRIVLGLGWQPFGTEVSTRHKLGNPRAEPGEPEGHIRLFTADALLELLALSGFETVEMSGWSAGRYGGATGGLLRFLDSLAERLGARVCDGLIVLARKRSSGGAIAAGGEPGA